MLNRFAFVSPEDESSSFFSSLLPIGKNFYLPQITLLLLLEL
jgi:hypothetical protein